MADEYLAEPDPRVESRTERPSHSYWWRLQAVFLEPQEAFREIARKPNVILPLAAVLLIGLVASAVVVNEVGLESILRQQIMQNPQVRDMPASDREQLIQTQANSGFVKTMVYAGPVIGSLAILLIAGLLLLGAKLVGSESSYTHVVSVAYHSFFAHGVVNGVLLILVVLVTADKSTIDIQNAVQSNLGILVDKTDSPVLFALASSLDLINFYAIYLLALGLSAARRKPTFAAALGVVAFWWALGVAIKVGFAALFS